MLKNAKNFAEQPEKYFLELDNNINYHKITWIQAYLKKLITFL